MHKVLLAALSGLLMSVSLACQAAYTKHPMVLVPGIFAFDSIAMIDYWYQIPSALQSQGNEVYVPKINAFENSFERGQQLIAQLDSIKVASLGRIQKFNLVAHSQGGITSRYVMNVRPDLVASVTTMSTPHTGSPLADLVSGLAPPGSLQGVAFETFANAVGNLVNIFSNNKASQSDINAMIGEFNQAGAAAFTAQFPAGVPTQRCGVGPDSVTLGGQRINLYSWGGGSRLTNIFDLSDALFAITGLAFGEANDGVTGVCSNHFGKIIKDNYRMNHIDINNQIFGVVSWFESNPKTLFKNHATRLKQAGL